MLELSVLKYLLDKEKYDKSRESIDINDLAKECQGILRTIDAYFTTTDDAPSLTVDDLSNLYFSTNRSKVEFYIGVFDALRKTEANDDTTEKLIESLRKNRLLRELSMAAYEVAEGRGKEADYQQIVEQLKTADEPVKEEYEFASTDLEQIVQKRQSSLGLRWRLNSLNVRLGSLRKGNFGFVFARPETGKTTFLASEITHMSEQLPKDAGPILWFNNEQEIDEVILRCYQASAGVDYSQLLVSLKEHKDAYYKRTGDKIKFIDDASISWKKIEKICAATKPSLVVFDQIDKIKGFDNDREDLRLGAIYIWARELAKTYCPVIGICQADGSGEGQRWLTMANVANAKTSKQAEADWILGIGKVNDPGYDNLRFGHLSKNKLLGDEDSNPALRHDRWEMVIEPSVARYKDIK